MNNPLPQRPGAKPSTDGEWFRVPAGPWANGDLIQVTGPSVGGEIPVAIVNKSTLGSGDLSASGTLTTDQIAVVAGPNSIKSSSEFYRNSTGITFAGSSANATSVTLYNSGSSGTYPFGNLHQCGETGFGLSGWPNALVLLSSSDGGMVVDAFSGPLLLQTAHTTRVTIDNATGSATFTGSVAASNLSGTNTGDQDLSGYSLTSHSHAIGTITGLGTGVSTALAVNVGSAGSPVVNGGALGTPSSGTLTNCTGLPMAAIVGAGTAGRFIHSDGAAPVPTDALRISGSFIGLNVTPSFPLHVETGASLVAHYQNGSVNGFTQAYFRNTNAGTSAQVAIAVGNGLGAFQIGICGKSYVGSYGSAGDVFIAGSSNTGSFRWNPYAGNDHIFLVGGTELMRLTSGGLLGINCTPTQRFEVAAATLTRNAGNFRSSDNNTTKAVIRAENSSNVLQWGVNAVGAISHSDSSSDIFGTTTGHKFGTATSQKMGWWNATPIVQPSSTGETTGFTAGSGTAVNDDSTFTGNVGTKAYRFSDVVKHLKNAGILAAS